MFHRYELIENQDKGGGDQADADGAQRRTAEPVADAGIRTDGFVQRHARQLSESHARDQKDSEKQEPALRKRHGELALDLRRDHRHRPHRDRHREEIGEDGDRATQQPGFETGDDGNGQSETNGNIETVHGGIREVSSIAMVCQ